jgi:arabinofuranosyltransferase
VRAPRTLALRFRGEAGSHWVLASLLLLLLLLAWSLRFIQDDAFISFRYAHNLVLGEGLVWNPGERVEGYTNFLWTLAIAAGLRTGFEPVSLSFGLGLTCFVASLLLTCSLGRRLTGKRTDALVAVGLLGSNYTFSCYATGGLETQLQTCLLLAATHAVFAGPLAGGWERARLARLSLLFSLALMTRLDSALPVAVLGGASLLALARARDLPVSQTRVLAVLFLPGAIPLGAWLLWKVAYYGDLFPNSFYVKLASSNSFAKGLSYVAFFGASYLILPVLLAPLLRLRRLAPAAGREVRTLGVLVVLWLLYVVRAGGDFMEFRFMVPVLPYVYLLCVWSFRAGFANPWLRALGVGLLLVGSLHHAMTFGSAWSLRGVESIAQLERHLTHPNGGWDGVGRALHRLFDESSGVVIATTAAGAIPYYARLEAVDMGGLNDAWVARHGIVAGDRPGHQRMATMEYLLSRKVNLLIGNPRFSRGAFAIRRPFFHSDVRGMSWVDFGVGRLPEDATMLQIPVNESYRVLAVYLTPHPAVDAAIETHGIVRSPILPTPRPGSRRLRRR